MYGTTKDPYCYADTNVLINKAGLKEPSRLTRFEVMAVAQRAAEKLPEGKFDTAHFKSIHFHLFQDVYDWAGKARTIRIAKGNSMFCFPENIEAELSRALNWLKQQRLLKGQTRQGFAAGTAHVLAEINAVHTFREGNGRTQLSFLALLAEQASHPIDLLAIKPKHFITAMIASFNGDETLLENQIFALASAGAIVT